MRGRFAADGALYTCGIYELKVVLRASDGAAIERTLHGTIHRLSETLPGVPE